MTFGYFKHDEYPLSRKCVINNLVLESDVRYMNVGNLLTNENYTE